MHHPLFIQSDGMVEHYVKPVEEHPRKVVLAHQRGWDERLPFPASLQSINPQDHRHTCFHVGREGAMCALLLPHPIEDQPMIDYVMNLVEWLHDIRYYARQPLLDFWTRGRSLKLQLSWEGPYKVII
jgi:hypothetical protein